MELVVVLFIIALMAALLMPSFETSEGRMKSEARKMASLLRYLNETSAAKKKNLSLRFDLGEGTVTPSEGVGGRELRLETLYGVELQTRGLLKEGELTVFFPPLGLREHMWVYLGHGDNGLTVALNPVSGRVKIYKGHG
jgi:hypothetical protein